MSIKIEKSALRKYLLERRDSTSSDYRSIASKRILDDLKKNSMYRNARNIACYFSIDSEVNTEPIISDILDSGKKLSLPRITDGDLDFREVQTLIELEAGEFGICEPNEDCKKSDTFDVIIVPVIGITETGIRLGYGKGFYDKFLENNSATTIALTYEKQIIKAIPSEKHDVKMQWIISEERTFKVK